jgi:hypothetical protein
MSKVRPLSYCRKHSLQRPCRPCDSLKTHRKIGNILYWSGPFHPLRPVYKQDELGQTVSRVRVQCESRVTRWSWLLTQRCGRRAQWETVTKIMVAVVERGLECGLESYLFLALDLNAYMKADSSRHCGLVGSLLQVIPHIHLTRQCPDLGT